MDHIVFGVVLRGRGAHKLRCLGTSAAVLDSRKKTSWRFVHIIMKIHRHEEPVGKLCLVCDGNAAHGRYCHACNSRLSYGKGEFYGLRPKISSGTLTQDLRSKHIHIHTRTHTHTPIAVQPFCLAVFLACGCIPHRRIYVLETHHEVFVSIASCVIWVNCDVGCCVPYFGTLGMSCTQIIRSPLLSSRREASKNPLLTPS